MRSTVSCPARRGTGRRRCGGERARVDLVARRAEGRVGDADGAERLVDVNLLAPVAEVARLRQVRRQVERALHEVHAASARARRRRPSRRRARWCRPARARGSRRPTRRRRAPSANACETRSASRSTALPDGDTDGAAVGARARLLRHVRQLVGDEAAPFGRARIVLAVGEVDVLALREGARAEPARFGGGRARRRARAPRRTRRRAAPRARRAATTAAPCRSPSRPPSFSASALRASRPSATRRPPSACIAVARTRAWWPSPSGPSSADSSWRAAPRSSSAHQRVGQPLRLAEHGVDAVRASPRRRRAAAAAPSRAARARAPRAPPSTRARDRPAATATRRAARAAAGTSAPRAPTPPTARPRVAPCAPACCAAWIASCTSTGVAASPRAHEQLPPERVRRRAEPRGQRVDRRPAHDVDARQPLAERRLGDAARIGRQLAARQRQRRRARRATAAAPAARRGRAPARGTRAAAREALSPSRNRSASASGSTPRSSSSDQTAPGACA